MRIADWEKNERRTSNVQHRTLNEKQSSFLIGRGRSCEIDLFLSLPVCQLTRLPVLTFWISDFRLGIVCF